MKTNNENNGKETVNDLNKNEGCGCQAGVKREVDQLVDQVDGYSKEDHKEKEQELRETFGKEN